MHKTKKHKIIIAITCVIVLVVAIIASILIITRKKFDITNETFQYNNHTKMVVDRMDSNLTISNGTGSNSTNPEYYSNGTVMVNRKETVGYGIYSFVQGRLIIPTNYNTGNLQPLQLTNSHNQEIDEYLFYVGSPIASTETIMSYYTDEGKLLDIVSYEPVTQKNYVKIKEKSLTLEEKRKGISVKTKNKFTNKAVAVSSVQYITSYVGDGYNYEVWKMTALDGTIYENLYEVQEDGNRKLLQTINNGIGLNFDSSEIEISVLNDGSIRLLTTTIVEESSLQTVAKLGVYDVNFKEKGTFNITFNNNTLSIFGIGNSLFVQSRTLATENKYDYAELNENGLYNYYKLNTIQYDFYSGDCDEVDCDFIVNTSSTTSLKDCLMASVNFIDNKILGNGKNIIINEDLKTKEIDYTITSVIKIAKDRYIVENDYGFLLIDEDFNVISNLGDYDSYFTTKESIILTNDTTQQTFVVDLDGTIVKRVAKGQITNIYDDTYYMIKVVENDGTTKYYAERLGVRKHLLYQQNNTLDNPTQHTFNNINYVRGGFDILSDNLSIITRVRESENNTFAYDFYNVDGDLLLTLTGFTTSTRLLTYWDYSDDNHCIVQISTNVGGEEYFMVIDK